VLWGVGLTEGVGLASAEGLGEAGVGLASAEGLALASVALGVTADGTLVVVQPAKANAATTHQATFIMPEV
jgi:hypothetical protein